MFIHLIGICFVLVLHSCQNDDTELSNIEGKQVLVYMIADNNLDYFAVKDINEMEEGLAQINNKQDEILVFIDRAENGNPSHPYLMKILPDTTDKLVSEILRVYPELNSADAKTLEKVLVDIDETTETPFKIRSLVLWSHGNAWLPPETSLYSDRDKIIDTKSASIDKNKSFGFDENYQCTTSKKEMDIIELANVLDPYHFDVILFDACFMGSIEVVYQLRNCCDYIICSPTEVSSAGFPYHRILGDLLENDIDPIEIARKKHEYYMSQNGLLKSSSVSVIKSNELEQLSNFMSTSFTNEIPDIDITNIDFTYCTSKLQQFDRLNVEILFDYYDLVKKTCFQHNKIDLFHEFETQWSKTVVYNAHTDFIFGSLNIENCNGLSIYIPQNYETRSKLEEYHKTLAWYEDSNEEMLFKHY